MDGYHQDCLELRPKFGGVGEFDGQSVLVYFGYRLFLYTRANCGESGHRQVQVCVGEDLNSFEPFAYVSFAGVPIDADIYFAHVYRTDRGTMAAIIPMAERPSKDRPTKGGIYMAESQNGFDFGPPVLLQASPIYKRRTFEVPVHYQSLVLTKRRKIHAACACASARAYAS